MNRTIKLVILFILPLTITTTSYSQFWIKFSGDYRGRNMVIDQEGVIYLSDTVVYVSEDKGATWEKRANGFVPGY